MPLRTQGYCGVGRGLSGLHWVWCNGRGPHLEWTQEPQASSPFLTRIPWSLQSRDKRVTPSLLLRNGPSFAFRVVYRVTVHLSKCLWDLRVFLDDARGCQCPFVLCLHPHYLRIGVWASRSYQEQIAKSRSFGMWHHHRGYVSNFLVRQPHLRCVEKVRNPLQTKQGN